MDYLDILLESLYGVYIFGIKLFSITLVWLYTNDRYKFRIIKYLSYIETFIVSLILGLIVGHYMPIDQEFRDFYNSKGDIISASSQRFKVELINQITVFFILLIITWFALIKLEKGKKKNMLH